MFIKLPKVIYDQSNYMNTFINIKSSNYFLDKFRNNGFYKSLFKERKIQILFGYTLT